MVNEDLLDSLSKEDLIRLIGIYSKNLLAVDGAWFQAVERASGMDEAIRCDEEAWAVFTVAEARRIKKFLNLPEHAGLEGLRKALSLRFNANVNEGEFIEEGNTLIYRNLGCLVQDKRQSKGMPFHPCKSVGLVEYPKFASVIDSRISCECLSCYPDISDESCRCAWKFTLEEE